MKSGKEKMKLEDESEVKGGWQRKSEGGKPTQTFIDDISHGHLSAILHLNV